MRCTRGVRPIAWQTARAAKKFPTGLHLSLGANVSTTPNDFSPRGSGGASCATHGRCATSRLAVQERRSAAQDSGRDQPRLPMIDASDAMGPCLERNLSGMARASFPKAALALAGALALSFSSCTQETQNRLGRAVQNWTGTDGVLEVYAGDKLVKRFVKIDKLTTAVSTTGSAARPYRFGYGVLDANQNGVADAGEKKVYFEFSDYSTSYIFYESPD